MFFKFNKYRYKPSYEVKNSSKIQFLIENYEPLFIKFINDKKSLSTEDSEKMFNGIKEVSIYIINGLFYQILENYSSKSGLDKKAEALYNIAKYQYHDTNSFNEYLEEELIILAEDSIFEAIGLCGNKIFKKETNEANIISYLKNQMFFKFINFLEDRVNNFKNGSLFLEETELPISEKEDREELINELLSKSKLNLSLDKETLNRLKECLIKENIDKDLIPYVEFLAGFKE